MMIWRRWGRRTRQFVVLGAVLLGLASLTAMAVPTAASAATPSECTTAQLSAQLKPGSPGAGQRYATVVLTNRSASTCTERGYGGLALLGAPGQGVPTDLRRVASPAPTTVTLAPGASVRSLLHWGVVPAGNEGATCEPTATAVVVTPPDQTTAALQPWSFGPVCQHGLIWQNAYVAGSAAF
jgi:hypothetical protein